MIGTFSRPAARGLLWALVSCSSVVNCLELAPEQACALLDDQGLGAATAYSPLDLSLYRCTSHRKAVPGTEPANSSLRYYAQGGAQQVRRLALELQVGGIRGSQQVHRVLRDTAANLLRKAAGESLPAAVANAIMAGTAGRWQAPGARLELRRVTAGASAYDLVLTVD